MYIRSQMILPLLALPLLSAATPVAAQSIPVQIQPVSKGSTTLVSKPVTSWKSLKFEHIVRQQTDFSCGAATLATIFRYAYGRDANESQVLINMMKVADPEIVREKGFSLLDMKNYVNAIGFAGDGFEVPFEALKELRVPGVALIDLRGYKHFVVIRKVEGDRVFVADPALGNRVMYRDEFEEAWNNVIFVVLGEDLVAGNVLQNPPPPLSAKRLFGMRSPIQNAVPADYIIDAANRFGI